MDSLKTRLAQRYITNVRSIMDGVLHSIKNKPSDLVVGWQMLMVSVALLCLITPYLIISYYNPAVFFEPILNPFYILFLPIVSLFVLTELLYQLDRFRKLYKFKKVLQKCNIQKLRNSSEYYLNNEFFEAKNKCKQEINKDIRVGEYRRIQRHVRGVQDLRNENNDVRDRYNFLKSSFFFSIFNLNKEQYQGIRIAKYIYHASLFIIGFIIIEVGSWVKETFILILYVWIDRRGESNSQDEKGFKDSEEYIASMSTNTGGKYSSNRKDIILENEITEHLPFIDTSKMKQLLLSKELVYKKYWYLRSKGYKVNPAFNSVKKWLIEEKRFTKDEINNRYNINLRLENFKKNATYPSNRYHFD